MQDFSGQNLCRKSFQHQDLTGANFAHADIRGANFSHAILHDADFTGVRAGLAPDWRVPVTLWGLGLCGLELGLTFGVGYTIFFFNPFIGMLADLVLHPLLTRAILRLSLNLLAIAGLRSDRSLITLIVLLGVLSGGIGYWGAVKGALAGYEAYLAAGNVEYPDSGIAESLAALVFSAFWMCRTGWVGGMAWEHVQQLRQRQSNIPSPPTDTQKSLLQTTTIALILPGVTNFRGADLTGANFTDANLQDTEFCN
jgi:Pentapeptide repeats (8 copies)